VLPIDIIIIINQTNFSNELESSIEMRDNKDVNGSSGDFNAAAGAEIMAIKASRQDGSTSHIKKGYLFFLLMTICIGTIQFGYSIGSWNTAFAPYKQREGWDDETGTSK
jgi:hypothetical protein